MARRRKLSRRGEPFVWGPPGSAWGYCNSFQVLGPATKYPVRKSHVINNWARRKRIQAVDLYWAPFPENSTDAHCLMHDFGAGFEMTGAR
jgi:hypothetical protein